MVELKRWSVDSTKQSNIMAAKRTKTSDHNTPNNML